MSIDDQVDVAVRQLATRLDGLPIPDWRAVQRRARRRTARNIVVTTAGTVLVVGGALGATLAVREGGGVPGARIDVAAPTHPSRDLATLSRPVADACSEAGVPIRAGEGVQTGAGKTTPDMPGEVFAVPGLGAAGPLATLIRVPHSGVDTALIPNRSIDGSPANLSLGDLGQAGVSWQLPDGTGAHLYTHGLDEHDVLALAAAITDQRELPSGLASLGMTSGATWAWSGCALADRSFLTVGVIHGTTASRYARLIAQPPGLSWDEGETTILVLGPGTIPTSRPALHQASRDDWQRMLTVTSSAFPPIPTTPPETPR